MAGGDPTTQRDSGELEARHITLWGAQDMGPCHPLPPGRAWCRPGLAPLVRAGLHGFVEARQGGSELQQSRADVVDL